MKTENIEYNETLNNSLQFMSSYGLLNTISDSNNTYIPDLLIKNKTIFLLELKNGYTGDVNAKNTFEYYWNKYSAIFPSINIIDSSVDINTGKILTSNEDIIKNNIDYMTHYYNIGYTLFLGFSRSTILKGVLPWFDIPLHSNALGISLSSSSDTLDIPKPVFRLQPTDVNLINSLNTVLLNSDKIYYIYSANELASVSLLNYLSLTYQGKINSFAVNSDSSNLTTNNIKTFFEGSTTNSTAISYLFVNDQMYNYINIFNDTYSLPIINYDISLSGIPTINNSAQNAIVNKYCYLDYFSLSTSALYREGLNQLKGNFSTSVPNSLLLINSLIIYGYSNILSIPSHNSILEFNNNNDLLYNTISYQFYTKQDSSYIFEITKYTILDPLAGLLTVNV
jgi:hypothetical protein